MARKPDNTSNLEKQLKLIQDQTTEALKMAGAYDTMSQTINKVNERLKGAVSIQEKMLKGQGAAKQIDDGLLKNKAKMQVLLKKIKAMKASNLKYSSEDAANERKKLQVEKAILLEQNKQNNSLEQRAKQAAASAKILMNKYIGTAALVATLWKGIKELDKLQTQYNKTFGLSNDQAMEIQSRMSNIAKDSGRMSITWITLHKTIAGIAEATGLLGSTMRADVIEEAAELSKLMGLSNKGMANLALNAQRTGQNMEEQSLEMIRGVAAAEKMLGVNVDVNAAFKTASETTGLIRANLGRSYGEITRVVTAAQALGMTLKDLASISEKMLNFQSSIEAELTAELFLGKQLNLEKARLYALTGDYESLQKEIVGQIGSEYEFLQLNVLQKKKYAEALGMSVDQMSDLVIRNADLATLEMEAESRDDKKTLEMLKQRTLQEEMKDLTEKLMTTFIALAEGPIGDLLNGISSILQSSTALYGIMGGIAAIKLGGLIMQVMTLAAAQKTAGITGFAAKAALNPIKAIAGLAVAGLGMALFSSMMDKETAKPIKTPETKQFANLGNEEMVTLEKGSAIFDQGESVVRTENFGKLNDTLIRVESILSNQKLSVHTEAHHGTRYR